MIYSILKKSKIVNTYSKFEKLIDDLIYQKININLIDVNTLIKYIHDVNGKAILVNPFIKSNKNKISLNELKKIIIYLKSIGLDGIEIISSLMSNDYEELNELIIFAKKNGLELSIGSNWLNKNKKYYEFLTFDIQNFNTIGGEKWK